MFPPFTNRTVLRTIVETSCVSERPFALQVIGSDLHLRYLPVMITRLMLSLRKAGTPQEHGWSLGESTTHATMRFAEHRGSVITRDEIHLDTFASMHEGAQSQT